MSLFEIPEVRTVHTYTAGMVLTFDQFKRIRNACYETGCIAETSSIWKKAENLYCYAYHKQGVKVYLYGNHWKNVYRLRVQVEPCRVLGEANPTALFHPDKKQYKELVKRTDKILKKLKIRRTIDAMKISRCDVTINVEFEEQRTLMEYLRIYKKSLQIPHYECVHFKKDDQKAKDPKTANAHSYCISCKRASFLIYDKIAQLEMIDRCDETLLDRHVLRFEAELKRPALKKHLGKVAMETNYKLLSSAAQKCPKIIQWYLNRLQPPCEKYVQYIFALAEIDDAHVISRTRDRMEDLLFKTSNKGSLAAALEDLAKEYHLVSGNSIKTVLKGFQKCKISPITLRNGSDYFELPPIIVHKGMRKK